MQEDVGERATPPPPNEPVNLAKELEELRGFLRFRRRVQSPCYQLMS
jgi:hypothetical protein